MVSQRKVRFVLLALLISFKSIANIDYGEVDKHSKQIPDTLQTAEEIAHYLTKNYKEPKKKLRAIYVWIAHNIHYDLSQINVPKSVSEYEKIVEHTLETRKGVCANYSELFKKMCESIGIESFVISGYTRQAPYETIDDLNHAWNGVIIDSNYYFVDVTWSSGYYDGFRYTHEFNDEFFLMQPQDFIITHVPYDPIWQFLDNPLSHEEYAAKEFSKLDKPGSYTYQDSIQEHLALTDIQQIKNRIRRIEASGGTNTHIKNYIEYSTELMLNNSFNEIITALNNANDEFNLSIAFANKFLGHLNKRFKKPKVSDEEIADIVDKANRHFESGEQIFLENRTSAWSFVNSDRVDESKYISPRINELSDFIRDLQATMEELKTLNERNTKFTKKYLKTWKLFRIYVVY